MNKLIRSIITSSPRRVYTTAATATSSAPSSSSSTPTSTPAVPRGTRLYSPSADLITSTLNSILSPRSCTLPTSTLITAVTAKSSLASTDNNARLSFLGRRVLRMHLTLFLSKAGVQMESEAVERMLDTRELGAGVGRNWGLEGCMRWREVRGVDGAPSGLYKARGTALEAITGAVYLKHGIQQSSHLFTTTILPHLNVPQSVRVELEADFNAAISSEN